MVRKQVVKMTLGGYKMLGQMLEYYHFLLGQLSINLGWICFGYIGHEWDHSWSTIYDIGLLNNVDLLQAVQLK